MLLLLVIAVSLAVVVRSGCSGRGRAPEAIRMADVNALAAEDTARFLGSGAKVVLLVAAGERERQEDDIRAFLKILGKAGIRVLAVESVPTVDPSTGHPVDSSVLTYDQYRQVGERYPGAQALVSLMGAPCGTRLLTGKRGSLLPPLVVGRFYGPREGLDSILGGRVAMAIVPRERSLASAGETLAGAEAWYRAMFEMVVASGVYVRAP